MFLPQISWDELIREYILISSYIIYITIIINRIEFNVKNIYK